MKNINKILIGIATTCVLLIGLDWIIGTWSEKMYYSSKYGIFHRQIYCLQESTDEMLILGSSRAAHHYVPQIFEDSLNVSCYNAGSDGMCIYYHYAILSSRIQRKCPPKIVVLEVLGSDVEVSNSASFSLDAALDRLAPHYGTFPSIDLLFAFNGWKEKVKLMSKTYRYNSKLVQTIKCNYIPWPEDRGYEALSKKMDVKEEKEPDTSNKSNKTNVENRKLVYIQKFIDMCKNNDIKLYMCYSPYYHKVVPYSIHIIQNIAKKNNVPFFEYSMTKEFQNPLFFKDAGHLNNDGAHIYTAEIAKRIKNDYK